MGLIEMRRSGYAEGPGPDRGGGGFRRGKPDYQDLVVSRSLGAQSVHGEKIGNAVRVGPGDGIDIVCRLLAVHLSEDGDACLAADHFGRQIVGVL